MKRSSLVFLLAFAGCGAAADAPRASVCRAVVPRLAVERPKMLLVTLDGVRWQEIFRGVDPTRSTHPVDAATLMPNLHALMSRGVALGAPGGSPIVASGPNFCSLPGYREIVGGRPSGCTSNECPRTTVPTFLDELRASGLDPSQVAVIGSWERLERAASVEPLDIAVSVGRTSGPSRDRLRVSRRASALLDEAAAASAWPGHGDYRPDAFTSALALEYAKVVQPRFLWVSLGDTDEYAHRSDYAGYLAALRRDDEFLGKMLAAVGDETIVVVTTDHGRAANFRDHGGFAPESQAVWLVAAGPGVERAAAPRSLSGVTRLFSEAAAGRPRYASYAAN